MPIVPRVGETQEKRPGAPRAGGLVASAVENQQQSDNLRAQLLRTAKEKPDEFAKALQLSGVTGLPVDMVKRNLPEIQEQADANGFPIESLRSSAPELYGWLTNQDENLILAKDDLGNLSGIPWAIKAVPQAFKFGQQQTELAKLRYKQMTLGLSPDEVTRAQSLSDEVNRPRRLAADGFWSRSAVESAKMLPGTLTSLAGGAQGGAQGALAGGTMAAIAGQLGPQVAIPEEIFTVPGAAIAGGSAGAAAGAAQASLELEAGLAFDEFAGFKDAAGVPLDQGTAAAAAMTTGMINAGLETTGLGAVVKAFPGVDKLLQKGSGAAVKAALKSPTVLAAFKEAGLKFAKGWTMETGTEVAQELVTVVAGELAKQAGAGQFDPATGAQIAKRLGDTLEAAALGSWMLPASGAGAGFILDAKRAQKAQTNVERIKALGDSAAASKLLDRAPAKYREYVEAVKKAAGPDGIQNIYVDAAQATQLFQAAGLDPAAFFEEVIGADGARDYHEALALGGRVAIPVEAYAEKIAGSDLHAPLMEHAAIDDEAMTPFEAKQFEASRDAELAKIYGEGRPADDPTNPIFDDTVGQLIGAGFSQKDAEDQARLRVAVYQGLGARAGLSPDEFLTRFPLTIDRPLDKVLTERNQAGPLDPLLDAIRSGKLPTDEELFGPRLLSAIVQAGGINLESVGGGDLAKVLDTVKRPGLVSEKGRTVEDMAETLAASGWRELFTDLDDYGRPGPDELVELIRADLLEPVRNPNTRNEERLAFRRAAESLGDELHRLGVDIQSLTNAQIAERLQAEDAKAKAGEGEVLEQSGPGTEAFDRWFEGSKVVDEKGEPLVVYHGTKSPGFDKFNTRGETTSSGDDFKFSPLGAWFTDSPRIANNFATDFSGEGRDGAVMPVYVALRRPFEISYDDLNDQVANQRSARALRSKLEAGGYDGMKVGRYGGAEGFDYVAFRPEQIKSAVGNRGTFAPNDPSILNQSAVETQSPQFQRWFGDSKVVDADGNPIVVYHGTSVDKDFSEFDVGDRGAWFGEDPAVASMYATGNDTQKAADAQGTGETPLPRVLPVYLSIQNPYVLTEQDWSTMRGDTASYQEKQRELTARVKAAGHDGINYGDGVWTAFRPEQIKSAVGNSGAYDPNDPNMLNQRRRKDAGPRGGITGAMPKDRKSTGRPFKISLFKRADLTTFTHEVGHMAFAMLADLAADFSAIDPASRTASQQGIVDDYAKMLEWVGAKDFASMTVPQLEKTARGLEAYVMEGKAPSPELRSVFARLRSFMVAVYRTLKGLNVELNDQVRGVYDRLLASEEQIQQAREKEKYDALWNAPDEMLAVGATGAEVASYIAATQAATDRAVDKLTAKVMAPIRRRREESFADLRSTVEKEVAAELDDLPVYRAIAALTGKNVPEDLVGQVRKLDREWLLDRYGQEWMNRNLLRRRVYAAEGGMSPDLAASVLGYGSGRELVEAIAQAPNRREYLKAETERRLNEIIPDPLRDGSISDEAVAALHNERRGDTLAMELKILNRAAGNGSVELPKQVARRIAERIVGDRRVRDINPNRYRLDERTASRKATEALIAKDYEAAAAAKRQELLAFYLWKVSSEAREEADRARDYLDSQTKTSARERLAKAGAEYVKAQDDITAAYGFRPRGENPSTLREFVARQDELGNETAVADEVIARTERPPVAWRDVSMNELRGARDAARNVAHLAKLSREALSNEQVIEWEDARTQMVDRLRASTSKGKSHTEIVTQGAMGRLGDLSRELQAEILRPETIIEWLDGGESGPWHDLFWNQANTAEDRRGQMRERVLKPLVDLVDKGGAKFRAHMADKIPIKTLGQTFTRGELISMALNMGNASNLDKLSRGGMLQDGQHVEFGPAVLEEVKASLTAEDWKLVQFMWDQVDSMWPEVVAFQKEMGGLVPDKVEAMPVETEHGTFRGGYWPVVYDPKQSATGAKQEAAKALSDVMGGITRAPTKKSHLKARTEVARPLLLNYESILVRHIDEVITDLTHRRFVLQANKILADGEMTNLIRERIGSQAFDSLRGMVANTIGDRKYFDPALETGTKMLDGLVRNTAVAALGLKVATAIGNLAVAPIQAAARVNPVHMVRGLGKFMSAPRTTRDAVWAMSPFMKQRAENFDASFADVLKSLRGEHSIRAQIARASMAVHRWADFMGTTGIWMGRYLQAIDEKETPDAAVRLADKAIRQTQTAGAPKDLSAFERSPQHKLARLFLGPMLIMQNRIRDAVGLRGKVKNMPEAVGTLFAVWFLPSFMFELAVGRGPDSGDDDELDAAEAAKWAAIKVGMYPLMTIPYLRDGASMFEGVVGGDNLPARLNPVGEAIKLLTQAAKKSIRAFDSDDVDAAELLKSWAKAAGPLIGLPTAPFTLAGDFVYDVMTGEYDPEGISDARYLFYRRDEK